MSGVRRRELLGLFALSVLGCNDTPEETVPTKPLDYVKRLFPRKPPVIVVQTGEKKIKDESFLLTEEGEPLLTEDGEPLLTEP